MTATKDDIARWLEEAEEKGRQPIWSWCMIIMTMRTSLCISCPVKTPIKHLGNSIKRTGPNEAMYSADECYNMSMDIEKQRQERRAFHWE